MKKYRVELCYSLYATTFICEASDEADAVKRAVNAFNLRVGPTIDHSTLSRWEDADMIEEVKENGSANPDNPEGP